MKKTEPEYYPPVENLLDLIYEHYTENNPVEKNTVAGKTAKAKENKILQYFGRISLIVLCIHGPVYRIVVKVVSIPLHMGTDAVRDNFLLAMIVVTVTMFICSVAYEVVMRIAPWMVGKKKKKTL